MFDLEQAIAEWRRQMLAAGIKRPVPLEELEIHLREEIGQRMKSGLNEQKAVEISIRQIGQPKVLKNEFEKIKRTFMERILMVMGGIFIVLVGGGFVLQAIAEYPDLSAWAGGQRGFLTIGICTLLCGACAVFSGLKKRKA